MDAVNLVIRQQLHSDVALVSQISEYIINAGGKRIRPYLTMVGNGSFDERALPVALAQEFIHIACVAAITL